MKDDEIVVFETDRLKVRWLTWGDFATFHDLQSDPLVMRYTGQRPMTLDEDREDLQRIIQAYHRADNEFWIWGVIAKVSKSWIGTCALLRNDQSLWEIGYRLLPTTWRQGFGVELTSGLIRHAFTARSIDLLVAETDRENHASVRILEKTMSFEREYYNQKEETTDRFYKLHRSQWLLDNGT